MANAMAISSQLLPPILQSAAIGNSPVPSPSRRRMAHASVEGGALGGADAATKPMDALMQQQQQQAILGEISAMKAEISGEK